MMIRNFALFLLLGLALLLADCAPQPPPTPTPTPGLSRHLLVEVMGDLSHKRPGWGEYLPLSFGTALDRDDLLRAAPDAHGLVVCADLEPFQIPGDYLGGLPCRRSEPVFVRGRDLVDGSFHIGIRVPLYEIEMLIAMLIARVRELGLDERATWLLEAEVYATYRQRDNAIALLEKLAAEDDAPAVYRRLGDFYLEGGLCAKAQEAYEHALDGYCALKDKEGEAYILVGLGLTHRCNHDDDMARDHLEQARDLYLALGDATSTTWVEWLLTENDR